MMNSFKNEKMGWDKRMGKKHILVPWGRGTNFAIEEISQLITHGNYIFVNIY